MKIETQDELKRWLADKPNEWAQIVAVRAALRALPLSGIMNHGKLIALPIRVFRASVVSWASCNLPRVKMKDALFGAASYAYISDLDSSFLDTFTFAARSAADDSQAYNFASQATNRFISPIFPLFKSNNESSYWWLISLDCLRLESQLDLKSAGREMTVRNLWWGPPAVWWLADWQKTANTLRDIDPNYSIWIDWYERRIRGERAAFDIPGDKFRKEDKKILRRLAEATDEDFWGKGYEYVNATLKGWLDEARERAAPDQALPVGMATETSEALALPPLPPQESGAIAYGVNKQGKLDRLPNSDQVHLSDVPDQRRAYADLREAAAELLGEGQRLGHRLQRALDRFLQSVPNHFDDAEAYLVWRDANALRRLYRAHREAAKTSEPDEAKLEPVIAEGLGGLLDLYNNFAFADDGLRAKDEARISPQERVNAEVEAKAAAPLIDALLATPQIATPEALDDIAADAEDAGLTANDPYSAQVLDQANRTKRNWVAALLTGAMEAAENPKLLGKRVTIGLATGVGTAVGTVVAKQVLGFEYAALFDFIATNAPLMQNYAAIAFGNYPHLPDLIERIKLSWLKSGSK